MTRVLIVEDERPLRRALAMNLTARGYEVSEADTATSALAAFAGGDHDVILLDLGLPDLSGMEVIRAVRAYASMPIIVLSARTGSSDKVAALDLGADDYVTKPFSIEELPRRLPDDLASTTSAAAQSNEESNRSIARRRVPAESNPVASQRDLSRTACYVGIAWLG